MPISAYSTTAGSNTSVAGINIAEGCPAANINNGMRAMMADTRSFYEGATWTDLGHTPTRTGATTFTINSDVTAYYVAGRRIRCTDSSTLYGTIASSSYSAPNTTVTVTLDSGSLSASLTAVAVSVIDPTGDPIGTAAITGNGVFADNVFQITGSSDATKKLAFEVDGLTTATTRTLTVQDVSGTVYVSGGTDIPIADGGTGASTASAAFANLKQDASDTATGVVELATTAEVRTGTDTTRTITPAGLKGALLLSYGVESSEQSYPAANTILNFAHGLGARPVLYQIVLRCTTADRNYSVGDEVDVGTMAQSTALVSTRVNSTNISMITNGTLQLPDLTTGSYGAITTSSWRVVFRAWA